MQKNPLAVLAQVFYTMAWAVCLVWAAFQLLRSWAGNGFELDVSVTTNIVGGYVITRALTSIVLVLFSQPGSARA
jgi:hypothetical protein